jgi:hypothetical protein
VQILIHILKFITRTGPLILFMWAIVDWLFGNHELAYFEVLISIALNMIKQDPDFKSNTSTNDSGSST